MDFNFLLYSRLLISACNYYRCKNLCKQIHLNKLESVQIDMQSVQTNILMFKPLNKNVDTVLAELKSKGILAGPGGYDVVRLVTHMNISMEDIKSAKQILSEIFEG